ncbi:ABC-three component system middle component 6 [Bacillus mobilis]
MNLKLSIVNISYNILQVLKTHKVYSYDGIYNLVCRELKEENIKELFNLSLTFLFSFDVIRYDKQSDNVELLINENIKDIF